jgi:maltose alpha-D-glucosyltransferase/alpha-amylase
MYGDEIGMGENLSLPGRVAVRGPMQWSPRHAGGFSPAAELHRPACADGPYG